MEQLTIHEKLSGQQQKTELVLNSFEKVSKGVVKVLNVPGISGTKTLRKIQRKHFPKKICYD